MFSTRHDNDVLINMVNLVIRVLQIIFAATVIGLYTGRLNDYQWSDLHKKLALAETAGALSLITAAIFAVVPFLVSYYPVAIAFVWDWILFFIWCAVFAFQRHWFSDKWRTAAMKLNKFKGVDLMIAAQWIDLTVMLLFLLSAIMGPVCLLMEHRCPCGSRTKG